MVIEICQAIIEKLEENEVLTDLLGADERIYYADPDDDPGFAASDAYVIVYEGDEGYTEEYVNEPEEIALPDQEVLFIAVAKTALKSGLIRDHLREILFGREFETTNYAVRQVEYSGSVPIANEEKKDRRKRRGLRIVLKGQYRKTERDLNDW